MAINRGINPWNSTLPDPSLVPQYRGVWTTTNYELADVVNYNNSLFIAVQATTSTDVPSSSNKWQFIIDGTIVGQTKDALTNIINVHNEVLKTKDVADKTILEVQSKADSYISNAKKSEEELRTIIGIKSLGRAPQIGDAPGTYRFNNKDISWDGNAVTATTNVLVTKDELATQSDVNGLITKNVELVQDVSASDTIILPPNKVMSGNHTVNAGGGIIMENNSTLDGVQINNTSKVHAVFIPPQGKATIANATITTDTTHSGIAATTNTNTLVTNTTIYGGEFGVHHAAGGQLAVTQIKSINSRLAGVLVAANGEERMSGTNIIGGYIGDYGLHGVQVWGGDAAVDKISRHTGVAVLGVHTKNSAQGAGIWATNTYGGTFVGNNVNNAPLEGLDIEGVHTFSITGNTVANVRSGATTVLFGSKNIAMAGNAISLSEDKNSDNALGAKGYVSGLINYFRDDLENIIVSGQVADCTVYNETDHTILPLVGKILIKNEKGPVGPKGITFVGCRFRNVVIDVEQYCERLEFISCIFEYDFDFNQNVPPVHMVRSDKILFDSCTWRLLVPAYKRNGPDYTPIRILQLGDASENGKPSVNEVTFRGCRILGWDENAGITVLTWPRTTNDKSKIIMENNAVSAIYLSSTNSVRRLVGNYHPDTLQPVIETLV